MNDLVLSVVLERVKGEMADRNTANHDILKSIREKLDQFNNELMNLRDSLNDAVKNITRATETNSINQKKLDEYKVHHSAHTHAHTGPHKGPNPPQITRLQKTFPPDHYGFVIVL